MVCTLLFGASFGFSQMVVPDFGTRGDVSEDFLEDFMTQFRRQLSLGLPLDIINENDIITPGIAGSLSADLTYLIASIGQGRYGISGELSEDNRLLNKAPYSVRVLIVDSETEQASDIISLPLSPESMTDVTRSLVDQIGQFIDPDNAPQAGSATLFVTSDPPEADILINGVLVGETPMRDVLSLAPGNYEIELRRDGFLPSVRNIRIQESREVMERFTLTPIVGGSVQVKSYPSANVILDGKVVGKTPLIVQALPGTHTLYIDRVGFKPISFDIRVENYRVSRVEQTLEPEAGNILFWDIPASELVFIDNILQTRDYVSSLPAGEYAIDVRSGGQKTSFTIMIAGEGVYELDFQKQEAVLFAP